MEIIVNRLAYPRRRLALFLIVVLVPVGLLTVLAIRTLTQDRELAVRRADDDRRQFAATVRQELLGRLETLKFRALSDLPQDGRENVSDPVTLIATITDGRLALPWEDAAAAAEVRRILAELPFGSLVERGESEELIRKRPDNAADLYRRALSSATQPAQAASAELLVARALNKAGHLEGVLDYSRRTLARPLSLVDEQRVPYALYAARRLSDLDPLEISDARLALDVARHVVEMPALSPTAVHMAASIFAALTARESPDVRTLAAAAAVSAGVRIELTEQALALQQTFPALSSQLRPAAGASSDPLWLPFGRVPWLLSIAARRDGLPPMLVAVDGRSTFTQLESAGRCEAASRCTLVLASDAGPSDYFLGSALPGLALHIASDGASGAASPWWPRERFYVAALALVLTLTIFGAYLLWRDVRRELRLADLRSQFVASVSHELKTPLTAIRMFAETLSMGRLADPQVREEYLDTIVNESERLTRLLNNVLDFSRIESGRKSYQVACHDLAAIVGTAARTMRYPLAKQGFELAVDTGGDLPSVRIDPDAIEQAILNLLDNALKYSGTARRIELGLERQGTYAVISVRDWGIGIGDIDRPHIFEKFFRAATPEARSTPGTGLGLTLVDHIVRSHGGFVTVETALGAGSTFQIHLPIVETGSPAAATSGAADERVMPASAP